MTPGGAADGCGLMSVGDYIVAVNDINTEGIGHAKVSCHDKSYHGDGVTMATVTMVIIVSPWQWLPW